MIVPHLTVDGTSPSGKAAIRACLNLYGAVVYQPFPSNKPHSDCPDSLATHLKGIQLGELISHPHSDASGCVRIEVVPGKHSYINTTSASTSMHTDGGMVDNLVGIVAMYCKKGIPGQGRTKLVAFREAFGYLRTINPEDLHLLFHPNALKVTRDGESASRPVFWWNQDGSLGGRYRGDTGHQAAKIEVYPAAERIFNQLRDFLEDEVNQMVFDLLPGELLVISNISIVHGRSAFDASEPRLLYRCWFTGKASGLGLGFMP